MANPPTINEFENLLANQEAIDKQINGASIENNEKVLFTDKKRHRFRWHSVGGSKGDVDKLKRHQQEISSQIEEA